MGCSSNLHRRRIRKLTNKFLDLNLWVGIFSVLGLLGIVAMLAGYMTVGLYLIAPLWLGAGVLGTVIIPILIIKNRKNKLKNDDMRRST